MGTANRIRHGRVIDADACIKSFHFCTRRRIDACRTQQVPGYTRRTDLGLRLARIVVVGVCGRRNLGGYQHHCEQNADGSTDVFMGGKHESNFTSLSAASPHLARWHSARVLRQASATPAAWSLPRKVLAGAGAILRTFRQSSPRV